MLLSFINPHFLIYNIVFTHPVIFLALLVTTVGLTALNDITTDIEEDSKIFFNLLNSEIGWIAGFITSIVVIITAIAKLVLWLKSNVVKENNKIREDTKNAINDIDVKITGNKAMIDEMKIMMEKINDKLDKNIDTVSRNTVRIDNMEEKLNKTRDFVLDKMSSSSSSV